MNFRADLDTHRTYRQVNHQPSSNLRKPCLVLNFGNADVSCCAPRLCSACVEFLMGFPLQSLVCISLTLVAAYHLQAHRNQHGVISLHLVLSTGACRCGWGGEIDPANEEFCRTCGQPPLVVESNTLRPTNKSFITFWIQKLNWQSRSSLY